MAGIKSIRDLPSAGLIVATLHVSLAFAVNVSIRNKVYAIRTGRVDMKLCFELGKTAAETLECLSTAVHDWLNVSKTVRSHSKTKTKADRRLLGKPMKQSKMFKIRFDQMAVYAFEIWQTYTYLRFCSGFSELETTENHCADEVDAKRLKNRTESSRCRSFILFECDQTLCTVFRWATTQQDRKTTR